MEMVVVGFALASPVADRDIASFEEFSLTNRRTNLLSSETAWVCCNRL